MQYDNGTLCRCKGKQNHVDSGKRMELKVSMLSKTRKAKINPSRGEYGIKNSINICGSSERMTWENQSDKKCNGSVNRTKVTLYTCMKMPQSTINL